jgi:hypothetical protein
MLYVLITIVEAERIFFNQTCFNTKKKLGLLQGVSTLCGTKRCSCHFLSFLPLPPLHEHAWMSHSMYLVVKAHGYLANAYPLEFH